MSPPIPGQDRQLVVSARRGDATAREDLGQRVSRTGYLFALQLTGNRESAQDVAQDAAIRFFQHLDRFDDSRPIEPWLFQIVHNRVRDMARRDQRWENQSLDAWMEQGHPEHPDATANPEADVERLELQRRIWRAVSQLSTAHREIFVLRDYHDLSYGEIADVLSIPTGTVMSRLHAARQHLRDLLRSERQRATGDYPRGDDKS